MDSEIVKLIQSVVWPIVIVFSLPVIYKLATTLQERYLSFKERTENVRHTPSLVETNIQTTEKESPPMTPATSNNVKTDINQLLLEEWKQNVALYIDADKR